MACDRSNLQGYLANFTDLDPVNAFVCPYAQSADGGLGLGIPLTMLLILGPVGLALTARTQHPAPVMVSGILVAGAFASTVSGQGVQIAALVLFFGFIAVGFFMYRRMKTSL